MKIKLSPIASNAKSIIEIQGDTLIYNGVSYDMSLIPDGAEVKAEAPAIGIIKRGVGIAPARGEIEITLQYFYNAMDCIYEERFPNNPYIIMEGVLNV